LTPSATAISEIWMELPKFKRVTWRNYAPFRDGLSPVRSTSVPKLKCWCSSTTKIRKATQNCGGLGG